MQVTSTWPGCFEAVPLREAAILLGVSDGVVLELVAQGVAAVCTRRPLPAGYWGAVSTGSATAIPQRQPFSGRHLARLVPCDATACVASGSVKIRRAMVEPMSSDLPTDLAIYGLLGSEDSTVIQSTDLLISRGEFERLVCHLGDEIAKLQPPDASDSALGALTRDRMKSLSLRPRDGVTEREAEYQRWRDCAAAIQSKRLYPASKRQLAVMVKGALKLPDSDRTIRARL